MTQAEQSATSLASTQPSSLTDEEVIQFLSEDPDFFQRNPDFLQSLYIPHEKGTAISLVEKQINLLREKNAALEKLGLRARDFERFSKLTSGVRRRMLEFPGHVAASLTSDGAIQVSFSLSAGTYATTVLHEVAAEIIDVALQEVLASTQGSDETSGED